MFVVGQLEVCLDDGLLHLFDSAIDFLLVSSVLGFDLCNLVDHSVEDVLPFVFFEKNCVVES